MAGAKNHDFHILNPSPWPIIGSFSALALTGGGVAFMHKVSWGLPVLLLGLLGVIATMVFWWQSVIKEANTGDHTPVVQLHHRYGMILFIASEVMFFVAWFWAYFAAALYPSTADAVGGVWPPKGVEVLDPFAFPLLNTLILLLSGTTVTWAHHALIEGDREGLKKGLWLTIILGALFSCVQAYEYHHAAFGFSGNIYGATFFMATGFHGFHVLVGTIFLIVCLVRAYKGDFTPKQHFGFEAAAWYWHFVDVVWLFLFMSIYVWGSHFGAAVIPHADKRGAALMARRGLPLGPTLLVAAAVPAMLAAGVWQLHRLEWKEALLQRLATAPALPVLNRPDLSKPGLDFRRAIVECAPAAAPPAIRGGRNLKGQVGYSYIFECAGGRLSLDAGWAPRPDAKPFRLAAAWPGMLREHDGPHYVLIADRAIPPLEPSAPPSIDEVPNSHLSYAVQWFLFATVLLAIYGVYVRRWRRASLDSSALPR